MIKKTTLPSLSTQVLFGKRHQQVKYEVPRGPLDSPFERGSLLASRHRRSTQRQINRLCLQPAAQHKLFVIV